MPDFTTVSSWVKVAGCSWACARRAELNRNRGSVCQPVQPHGRAGCSQRGVAGSAVVLGEAGGARRGLLDLEEELGVRLGLAQLVQQQLDGLLAVERVQDAAQLPDDLELLGRAEDLLLAGTGGVEVDGREDPLVREAPCSMLRAAPKKRFGG